MSEQTLFQRIIADEIPGVVVHEDEHCVVLMDAFPSVPGQTMVIPREPIAYFVDAEDPLLAHLMQVAKKIAQASDQAFKTSRTCLVIEGFEVPHLHLKLFPVSQASGVTALTDVITNTDEATLEERQQWANLIKAAL